MGLYDNEEMEKTTESEEYIKLIGWLKDCRLERNLSLRQLAAKMKISHTYIQKIETNQRRLDVYEYVTYCRALGVNPSAGLRFFAEPLEDKK